MTQIQIAVRDVNEEAFREFKSDVVKRGMKLGTALTLAMEKFRSELLKPRPKFTSLRPVDWGRGSEKLSEQVDEILYGG
ncbi:TPA: hypothetical protein HA219_03450 [Candidatus Woesearchaeota archaeon]|nr:hypothetical protein [uncultured archaeon]AQS32051.1 hypothetical protein [uncultured archaeon]MBS3115244.1 hypothetical protein [Candidatus Woesearchaeota archaeon]HIH39749.1 hypothetical protein [Candidatus Woesearchaeota archaeon]